MAAQDYSAMKQDYFNKRRQEASQQAQAATAEASDALTRRFAAMGSQGSGAAIGAQLKARDAGEAQRQKAESDVNAQELQSNLAEAESEKGRQFQMSEAEKGRQAQMSEAEKGRQAQMSETEKARQFQEKLAGQDLAMKKDIFGFEKESKLKELDFAKQQMDLDAATTEFNKNLALHIQGIKSYGQDATNLEQQNKAYKDMLDELRRSMVLNSPNDTSGPTNTQKLDMIANNLYPPARGAGPAPTFDQLTPDKQKQVLQEYTKQQQPKQTAGFFINGSMRGEF